ncbi:DUF3152 domain-containing protein [Streptomyces sp. NPDC060194]|uniref:DUF3152 domain-containing protein n=1 Tax=Streptomyces sp. NPDC060194 TaxID=3347069 RepID=UPI003667722A
MGRHSRREPAAEGTGAPGPVRGPGADAQDAARGGTGRRRRAQEPGPAAARPAHPGSPANGVTGLLDGTAAHGFPRMRPAADDAGTPPHGLPAGAGDDRQEAARQEAVRREYAAAFDDGVRQEYLDAFDDDAPRTGRQAPVPPPRVEVPLVRTVDDAEDRPARARIGKGSLFVGAAAALVTALLAVLVSGQVRDEGGRADQGAGTGDAVRRGVLDDPASRSEERPGPSSGNGVEPNADLKSAPVPTYDELMGRKYPLDADLRASGEFKAVRGLDRAPGRGKLVTYRVDVEKGLDLDGELFATAVQKTLNDKRSWAHNDERTFQRVPSGQSDFVITLASPGTTGELCAKSGLDTTIDNVSCDSASTERVVINAYRWARGSKTYGDAIHPYRQMLINHEVGHRLGFGHVSCSVDGALAPVMQQQTKFLEHDGIRCKANPWPFPGRSRD